MRFERRNLYSIGHVAKVTGVAVSTLRSWEDQGLLHPSKVASGRRSYSDDDVNVARRVNQMRRMSGQSLAAIRRTLEAEAGAKEPGRIAPAEDGIDAIGASVRNLRHAANMSLRRLSELTEIGVSQLSMFERGTSYLSPARLSAVAAVFDRSLVELLGGTSVRDTHIVRKGQGRIVGSFGPGVRIEQLTVAQHLMDAEIWTIEPGRGSDGFYSHKGEELILLLEGALQITLAGGDAEVLHPGDGAYFSSRIEHRWRNPGPDAAVVLWVNTDTERLGSMTFERSPRIALGVSSTLGAGESGLSVELPPRAKTLRVIETHTAGHPTRILIEPLPGLDGNTVAEKVAQFRQRYDELRPLLLHEPRGHAGSFGLIPTASNKADFGAFFASSYGYPEMCGHAIIGYAKALKALGRIKPGQEFRIEVPAGVFDVRLESEPPSERITLRLPRAFVVAPAVPVVADGRTGTACIAYGAEYYAIVNAADFGLTLQRAQLQQLLATGAEIRRSASKHPAIAALPEDAELGAILFVEPLDDGAERQFLAIDAQKYDRSPGVTGLAARLAQKLCEGTLAVGRTVRAESIFGGLLEGRILEQSESDGAPPSCAVAVTGRAHLHGVSTLIHEADDPMGGGFLSFHPTGG